MCGTHLNGNSFGTLLDFERDFERAELTFI